MSLPSIVWKFYVLVPDDPTKAKCTLCPDTSKPHIRGSSAKTFSTKPLLNHLETLHPRELKEKKDELSLLLPPPSPMSKKTPSQLKARAQQRSIKDTLPGNLTPWKHDDSRYKKASKKLVQFIIEDNQPFTIVEDRGFINYSLHLNPWYIIPSRKVVTELVEPEFDRVQKLILQLINTADFVSFTSDIWTDSTSKLTFISLSGKWITNYPFYSSTLFYFISNYFLCCLKYSCL